MSSQKGLNNKKYIVYEKLNNFGGGKSFNNAKDACKYAKEILQIMDLPCLRIMEKLGKMFLMPRVSFYWKGRGRMTVYTFTFITMVSMYLVLMGSQVDTW